MDGGTEVYGTLVSNIQTDVSVTGKPVYLTASGNDITVDVKKGNMTNPVVTMSPIQNLNGYDNPWVGGAGKNKLNVSNGTGVTMRGVLPSYDNNGGLNFVGTPTETGYIGDWRLNSPLVLSAGTYTFSFSESIGRNVAFLDNWNGVATVTGLNRSVTVTLADVTSINRITISALVEDVNVPLNINLGEIQIESGSTATTYEPYENICPIYPRTKTEISVNGSIITREYGQEIYGGTDEIAEGVLTNDRKFLKLKLSNGYKIIGTNCTRYAFYNKFSTDEVYDGSQANSDNTISSIGTYVYNNNDTPHFYIGSAGDINIFVPNGTSENLEVDLCATATTPQEILTTKGYVPLDKGTNEITVSNNDIITFDYCSTLAGKLSGTLYYIEDGLAPSGYLSGSGNFLALHLDSEDWDIYTSVKVGLYPSEGSGMVEILTDEEKICVGKITSNDQVFKVESTDGTLTKTDVYSLSDLVLETE